MTHNEIKEVIRFRTGWLGESDILRLRNVYIDKEPAISVKCVSGGRTKQLMDRIFNKSIIVHNILIKYKDNGNLFTVRECDIK